MQWPSVQHRSSCALCVVSHPPSCPQVIVADTFTNLSAQHMGPDALPSQRSFVLLVTGLLVLLMCFPRNLQALGELGRQAGGQADRQAGRRAGSAACCMCAGRVGSLAAVAGAGIRAVDMGCSTAVSLTLVAVCAAERVSFAAVVGFVYTSGAVLVRGLQVCGALLGAPSRTAPPASVKAGPKWGSNLGAKLQPGTCSCCLALQDNN